MLTWIRERFGPVMVGGIIGFIAFVFIFSGVFSPSATKGMHEGSVAGLVNGEAISLGEFNRRLNQRMEMFKSFGGGLSEAQLRAFRVREGVFQELVNRKLMSQQAQKMGLVASDEALRESIREMPQFQQDGRFDAGLYRRVLEANNLTPASFERMMREDLSLERLSQYFRNRVRVSEEEIRKEFLTSKDTRNIKYVLLTSENGRKGVKVAPSEIEKYLKDSAKLNLVKSQYEARKTSDYKGMTFEQAREKIASELLASDKTADIQKVNEQLASQVAQALTADKGSDARVNAMLKAYGAEVKSTGHVNRGSKFIPGIGEAKDLFADAFAAKSPIDPAQGGKAKKYSSGAWWLVAVISESKKPDLSKLESEREQLLSQLHMRKERDLYEAWMKKVSSQAKIEKNDSVVGEGGANPGDA